MAYVNTITDDLNQLRHGPVHGAAMMQPKQNGTRTMNSFARNIAVALVGLGIGLGATSANAGIFADAVKGAGKKVIGKVTGADAIAAGAAAGQAQKQKQQAQAPARTGQWDWLSNKPYIDCLKLYHYGDFGIPSNATPAQRADLKEKGRRYCNRTYGYGG